VRRVVIGATLLTGAIVATVGAVNIGEASASLTGTLTVPAQSPNPIVPGQAATYSTITVTRTSTTPADVMLSASGLPSGAFLSDTNDGNNGCVAVVSNTFTFSNVEIITSSGLSGGSYPFTLTATGYNSSGCGTTSGGALSGSSTLVVSGVTWSANGGLLTCGTANSTTVPAGATYVTATLTGGGGGGGGAGTNSTTGTTNTHSFGGNGAPGGSVSVTYPVTAGNGLYVNVGCGGGGGVGDAATASGGAAGLGYTSGGPGGAGSGSITLGAAGGGGGGSSALCVGTTSCTTPISVAAGGGGGGAGCGYNGATTNCTGASGADGGAGGSTNSATNAGNGGTNVNGGGGGTTGGTGSDGLANSGGSSGESSGSGFGGSGGGAGVQEGSSPGGPGGGGGGGTGGAGATNDGGTAGSGGTNNTPGGGGNTGITGSTTEGAAGSTTTLGNGGAGGTTTKGGTGSNEVNMGGGGGGAGWTGGGGGGPNYTVSTGSQFSAGGGGGGSSWGVATASPTFSPITDGLASSCGPGDSSFSTGLSLGLGGYGDGQLTGGTAGIGDAGCPGSLALTFHSPPSTPTLTSGSLTVTAGSAISAAITSSGATSYTESGILPSGVNFSSSSGALMGTPTSAGSYPFTVTATGQYGTSSAGSFTLTVNAAGASTVAFVQQPSDTFTGTAISPGVTVQVEDAYGNPVSDSGLSVTLTPSASTIASGATSSTSSSGLATFSVIKINAAAANLTLTASATGLSTSSPSSSFDVTVLVDNGANLTDTASDAGSGVASVSYFYCAGYSGSCTSSNWHAIGSPATNSPYSVVWGNQPADGAYQVVAVGTDYVTNVSGPSTSIPVTVDNTPPTGGSVEANNSTSASYNSSGTMPLSVTNFTDSTSGMASNVVTRAAGTLSGNVCGTLSGATVVTITSGRDSATLSNGCYQYTLTGTNNAGAVATATSAIVKVDTSAPSGAITSPSTGTVSGTTVSLQSTSASDSVSGVASVAYYACSTACTGSPPGAGWTLLGTGTSGSPWSASWDTTTLANGSYTLKAVISDNAGNTAVTAGVAVTVSNSYSFVVSDPGSPTAGTADPTAITVQLQLNGSNTGTYEGIAYAGSHAIAFTGSAMAASPNATAATPASASLTFNSSGQATIAANTFTFYDAQTGVSLTATDSTNSIAGTSVTFSVSAGTAKVFEFTNCSVNNGAVVNPCGGTANVGATTGGNVVGNVTVLDSWGNTAKVSGNSLTVALSLSSTTRFTLSPSSVTILVGASQSSNFTVAHPHNSGSDSVTLSTTNSGFTEDSLAVST
jgi:Bacterial Ig domain